MFDDPGVFVELSEVNRIRPRVQAWREAGYAGVSGITKRLLEHWQDPEERRNRLFFCQLEAIETLIWLTEASPAERQGIDIPSDGGDFTRSRSALIPERNFSRMFEETVTPLHEQIDVLRMASAALAKARTRLLARPMNREIAS